MGHEFPSEIAPKQEGVSVESLKHQEEIVFDALRRHAQNEQRAEVFLHALREMTRRAEG
jgi:hypothetical protein